MKSTARCSKPTMPRPRTSSGSSLTPSRELLRDSIRHQVSSEPYVYMSREKTWQEATRLAASLAKTIAINVIHFLESHRQQICAGISAKTAGLRQTA
ncbi:Protein CBG05095 [Caenorhabditis briggsae]|uniref:Protein CBG05095 n=1 Tax=Caenorhabditis briggsae TaxID=6238 RepID=A8WZ96_CAEBR|nr:Protein CBG05095 [Caenorhabditis briggsae]CAP25706.1 Protein CBG05095 [Caenorhabditis briggsae]